MSQVTFTIPLPATIENRSNALAANRVKMKGSDGQFLNLAGFNSGPAQWIQFHEGAAINATTGPADTDVPLFSFYVGANQPFSMDAANTFKFEGSLWACNSSTEATLTAGAADCHWLGGVR